MSFILSTTEVSGRLYSSIICCFFACRAEILSERQSAFAVFSLSIASLKILRRSLLRPIEKLFIASFRAITRFNLCSILSRFPLKTAIFCLCTFIFSCLFGIFTFLIFSIFFSFDSIIFRTAGTLPNIFLSIVFLSSSLSAFAVSFSILTSLRAILSSFVAIFTSIELILL